MPRYTNPPPINERRSCALKTSKAALARALASQKERRRKVALVQARLANEQRLLAKVDAAVASLRWSIQAMEGCADAKPIPNSRRVTPLPRGAAAEAARDIMRESGGVWLAPDEVARSILMSFGVEPVGEVLDAVTNSVSSTFRQMGKDGSAEHDGGQNPRRWRCLAL